MNVYSLRAPPYADAALKYLAAGVVRVGVLPNHPAHPGCSWCVLEVANGSVVHIFPSQQDLESKFEVFPVGIAVEVPGLDGVEWKPVPLPVPVTITLQETEEWLDPDVPCEGALGGGPIMQCQGLPGSASRSATAVCRYIGGIELVGPNGRTLFVATASFPYTLHVEGIAEDERVSRANYRSAA